MLSSLFCLVYLSVADTNVDTKIMFNIEEDSEAKYRIKVNLIGRARHSPHFYKYIFEKDCWLQHLIRPKSYSVI